MTAFVSTTTTNELLPFGAPGQNQPTTTVGSTRFEPWAVCPGASWRPWNYITTFGGLTEIPRA